MKRLILLSIFLFIMSLSYAANKMSMVTYFPVPYVAYSQVSADQQLDVGLTTTCKMNLGCNESSTNLKASTVNLTAGKLELNNGKGIAGTSITLGTGTGNGQISFKDVRIQGGNMQSLNANTMNVQTLNLFGKPFPPCRGKGGSDGQMKWQQLKLQGYSGTDADGELYLVCGNTEKPVCAPTHNGMETYTGECPTGKTGTVTYTWDYTACKYNENAACEGCTWKYKRWRDYPYDFVLNGTPQNAMYCPMGHDVDNYRRYSRGEMTRTEYLRWVCSPVIPKLGGAQVWIPSYGGSYRHCEQVDNPPVPTSEKDLCIMESSYCNSTEDKTDSYTKGCPFISVSFFQAVCE